MNILQLAGAGTITTVLSQLNVFDDAKVILESVKQHKSLNKRVLVVTDIGNNTIDFINAGQMSYLDFLIAVTNLEVGLMNYDVILFDRCQQNENLNFIMSNLKKENVKIINYVPFEHFNSLETKTTQLLSDIIFIINEGSFRQLSFCEKVKFLCGFKNLPSFELAEIKNRKELKLRKIYLYD